LLTTDYEEAAVNVQDMTLWTVFGVIVVGMFLLDVAVLHRRAHTVGMREALAWTAAWVTLALGFGAAIYVFKGADKGLEFLTGYVIEQSLSVDNVFVFAVIFAYFGIPKQYQHRVLFWGVAGAVVMRGIFILLGVAVLETLHWAIYVMGAFLIFTAFKLGTQGEADVDPNKNLAVRLFKRFMPVYQGFDGQKLFVRSNGRTYATLLFLALLVIETTDIVFAIDSVPAILSITRDPFIVYTSNMFAVLGLRALYFVVAGSLGEFRFLKYGLAAVLGFVGVKMLISEWYHVPVPASLAIIVVFIGSAIGASIIAREIAKEPAPLVPEASGFDAE
jgi:tellurite resistance protein TerC